MNDKALIIDIQRMSTEDGPGIRSTVFFKGCNLKCAWCHNPESIEHKKQIEWYRDRCINCLLCIKACKQKALSIDKGGLAIDRGACVACEACVRECPTSAMNVKGIEWEADKLAYEVLKDCAFFADGGGVTVSGGEPLMQSKFVAGFLAKLKAAGVHTALDTAGLAQWSDFEMILPNVDLVLFDLKIFDAFLHKRFTNAENRVILENAGKLAEYIAKNSSPTLWIRTPIIPNATDSADNIRDIARFIKENLAGAATLWELCSFNNLCRDKYERLNLNWTYKEEGLMSKQAMTNLFEIARSAVGDAVVVAWSGSTRIDD